MAALALPQPPAPAGLAAPPPAGPQASDPSPSAPATNAGTEQQAALGLTKPQQDALLEVRKTLKEANVGKRMLFLRRVQRAFETLKNNPYILFNDATQTFDTLDTIMQGANDGKDVDLYQSNDNVYQMLALAFIAALSPDVPKTRYQPGDADDEEDIAIARKASVIQAYNERRNGIKALQKLELLYLWCAGSYFCYTRHVIDKNRAGIDRQPIMGMVPQQILPPRYICSNCGTITPDQADQQPAPPGAGLGGPPPPDQQPNCPGCSTAMTPADWYEGYSAPVPTKIGMSETAAGMTAMDIYSGLNVDVDPDAQELYESLYLDLEGETNIAWVRAQFPALYKTIQQGEANGGSTADDTAKMARQALTTPGGSTEGGAMTTANVGTYSRCWLQVEAFNILEDEVMAQSLAAIFPNGCKLMTFSNDLFLQAVPERMTDKWTWCPTLKGLGMYPFAVGDVALDVQVRINDAANNVHAYMDRLAFGTILFDADVITDSFSNKSLAPGNMTGVKRTGDQQGTRVPLNDLMYQPEFHIDSHIFEYGQQLIQLAQVLVGVQPQTFGGSDPNVQTMGGQAQALKTALGRMMLFWDQIREEHARRAQNSVKCSVSNMDAEMKIVIQGDVDGDYRTETLLASQLTGEFLAYAESDEGFPASYEEVQARIMQLLEQAQKNPFLLSVLSDPDTQKVVARYILPDQIRLPGERERARLKIMCQMLSKSKPQIVPGPTGQPIVVPSMHLNPKYDDMQMAQTIAKSWCQENWQQQPTNPDGFANVLALLSEATQMVEEAQAAQAIQMQQQKAQGGAPSSDGPPPPPGP